MVSLNKMRCSKKLSELVIKVRRIRIERCRCAISISNSNGIPSSTYIYIYILTWFVPQIRSFHPRFFLFFLSFFTEFHISLRGIRLPSVTRNVEWWDEREKRRERNGGREEETDGPGERGSGWLTNKRSFRSVAREYFMRSDERRSRGDGRDFEITIGGGKRGRGGDARERVSKKRRWTGTGGREGWGRIEEEEGNSMKIYSWFGGRSLYTFSFGYLGRVGDRLPSFHEAAPMLYRIRGFFLVYAVAIRHFFTRFFWINLGEEKSRRGETPLSNSPSSLRKWAAWKMRRLLEVARWTWIVSRLRILGNFWDTLMGHAILRNDRLWRI